ncbi:MAG TPA: HAD-IA family hydrolase [Nocardioides sp.]|jgi:sugar-phosphatase|nr:HAD-IA family hydrolase [Nocardioides sp.]
MPFLELTAAAALFDMDGTLIDSTAVVEALWSAFCREHDVDADALLAFAHGRPTRQTLDRFLPHRSPSQREELAARFGRSELDTLDGIVEIPGAAALLGSLELPWAVVTSAPRELAVRRLAAAGLPLPDVLVPADEIRRGKPAPDGYLRAAGLLGADPRACVALEDTEPGVRAAQAAGSRVVVIGDLDSDVTAGLHRLPDLTGLALRRG